MRIHNREEKIQQVRNNIKHGGCQFTWLPGYLCGVMAAVGHSQQITFTTVEERLAMIERQLKMDYAEIQKEINEQYENMPLEEVRHLDEEYHPFKENLLSVIERNASQKQETRIKELEEENERLKAKEKQNGEN